MADTDWFNKEQLGEALREISLGTFDFFKQPNNAAVDEKKRKDAVKKLLEVAGLNENKKIYRKVYLNNSTHNIFIEKKTEKRIQVQTNDTTHRVLKWNSAFQKFMRHPTEQEMNEHFALKKRKYTMKQIERERIGTDNASQLLRKRPWNTPILKRYHFHRSMDSEYLFSKNHYEFSKMKNVEKVSFTGQKRPLSTAQGPIIVSTAKRQKTLEQCEQANRTTRNVGVLSSHDENSCVRKDKSLSDELNWQDMVNDDQVMDSNAKVPRNTTFTNDVIDEFENDEEFNLLEFIDSSYDNDDSTPVQFDNHARNAKLSKEIYQQGLEFLENQLKF